MQTNSVTPPYLKKGDKVAITCPAKKLPGPIDSAVKLLESWGLEVVLGETVTGSHHQFAGNDELRTKDLQGFLNDTKIKAIFAARGGYGTIRIIDKLDFNAFKGVPKWVVGFSDITVLHSHILETCNVETIHGQMPLNVPDGSKPSLESLRKALFGEELSYSIESSPFNREGYATAPLIGGNLSILVSMNNSISEMDYNGKILFLEEIGEYMYALDRMLWTMKRAGNFAKLKGLIIGGFTDLKDNDIPFGYSLYEMINNLVKDYDFPVCFDFPAGHIPDNHALIFGRNVKLDVGNQRASLTFE